MITARNQGGGSGWRPDVVAASHRQAETTQFNKWSRPHDALRATRPGVDLNVVDQVEV